MTGRGSRRSAWTIVALSVVLYSGHLFLGPKAGTLTFDSADGVFAAGFGLFVLAFCIPGALIVVRQPHNTIGWLLLAIPLMGSFSFLVGDYATYGLVTRPGSLPAATLAAWVDRWTIVPTLAILIPLFLLFPDGKVPSARWRPVLWLAVGAPVVATISFALTPGPMTGAFANLAQSPVENPFGLESLKGVISPLTGIAGTASFVAALLAAASLFFRFRSRRGDERQQVKWLAFIGIAFFIEFAMNIVLASLFSDNSSIGNAVFGVMFFTLILGIPGACAIAVLKYRLYDIDVVINKTLVYASLAVFITAVYVGIVVGIGAAIGAGSAKPNLGLSILATAVVAVAFQPVRERVQRFANRLVYGKRATPYEVLSEFGHRMAGTYAAEDILPRMARILAEGTGAKEASVWLGASPNLSRAASWPITSNGSSPHQTDFIVPVSHQGEELGALSIVKSPGDRITPAEEKLTTDLASQAGLVLRNVKLIEDLKASRVRLVQAQDEERRKIERNIHDGAQQQLVALNVKLGLTRTIAASDPVKAEELLGQLQEDTTQALSDLRDLARGIYPPLLADQGLTAALEAQARKSAIPVTVSSDSIVRFSQDIEAAVYFCTLEALQNVAKYANATQATIALTQTDGTLSFAVTDDGNGFDSTTTSYGTGLQGMADRLHALGGEIEVRSEPRLGTTVVGRVPVPALEPVG